MLTEKQDFLSFRLFGNGQPQLPVNILDKAKGTAGTA